MIPSVATAQRSSAPPVNMLYMPSKPPLPCLDILSKYSLRAWPLRPGMGIIEASRQMPRTTSVKMMRDLSSGILKQLAKVLAMARNMSVQELNKSNSGFGRRRRRRLNHLAGAAFAFDLRLGGGAEGMGADR